MYRCEDCGEIFEYPKIESECVGECWGQPAFQDFPYCPHCGSDCFEEYDESEEENEEDEEEC